jgi:hypothetical protein
VRLHPVAQRRWVTISRLHGSRPRSLQLAHVTDDPVDEPIRLQAGWAADMRAWAAAHLVFSTILLGSLAGNERAVDVLEAGDVTLQTTAARIGQSQGLDFREYAKIAGNIPIVVFEAPGCFGPVLVIAPMILDEEPVMRFVREQDDIIRYVYIDRTWEKPERLALLVERSLLLA